MSRRRHQEGAVTVEFALVLPAFLALMGLLIGAGWLGAVRAIVDHGAREGLRAALIRDAETGAYPDGAAVAGTVEAATPLVSPSAVTVTGDLVGRNTPVTVEVTYEISNPVAAFLPLPDTITMSARAEGRRE